MTKRLIALILMLVSAFTYTPLVAAQASTGKQGWSAVRTLPAGTKLQVKMKSGETIEGELSSASDTALTISRKSRQSELERAQIQKIYRVGGRSVGKATLIGLGVGAGVGAAVGAGVSAGSTHESGEAAQPVLALGAGGAIVGAVAGLVTGLLGRKRVLIYESQ